MTVPHATVPDTTAWAAEHLRALGWVVVAPVEAGDAVPEPKVGQAWTPASASASARVVATADVETVSFLVGLGSFATSVTRSEWNAWVRRTNARPLPTPTDGDVP